MEGMFICCVKKNMAGEIKSHFVLILMVNVWFFKHFLRNYFLRKGNLRFWSLNRNPDCKISVKYFLLTAKISLENIGGFGLI